MKRILPELRGRGFAVPRTLMQATPPIGAALAGPLLAANRPGTVAVAMAVLASVSGVLLVVLFRREPAAAINLVALGFGRLMLAFLAAVAAGLRVIRLGGSGAGSLGCLGARVPAEVPAGKGDRGR